MTKKSSARLARDAMEKKKERSKIELKDNNCWGDLNDIYQKNGQMLMAHTALASVAQDKELLECIPDKATIVDLIRGLARDTVQLSVELKEIYSNHADKTGGSQDANEVMRSIQIAEHYNLWVERYSAVIMPTVYQITEQLGQAETILNEKRAAAAEADALNPNVITDVEVKDVIETHDHVEGQQNG